LSFRPEAALLDHVATASRWENPARRQFRGRQLVQPREAEELCRPVNTIDVALSVPRAGQPLLPLLGIHSGCRSFRGTCRRPTAPVRPVWSIVGEQLSVEAETRCPARRPHGCSEVILGLHDFAMTTSVDRLANERVAFERRATGRRDRPSRCWRREWFAAFKSLNRAPSGCAERLGRRRASSKPARGRRATAMLVALAGSAIQCEWNIGRCYCSEPLFQSSRLRRTASVRSGFRSLRHPTDTKIAAVMSTVSPVLWT